MLLQPSVPFSFPVTKRTVAFSSHSFSKGKRTNNPATWNCTLHAYFSTVQQRLMENMDLHCSISRCSAHRGRSVHVQTGSMQRALKFSFPSPSLPLTILMCHLCHISNHLYRLLKLVPFACWTPATPVTSESCCALSCVWQLLPLWVYSQYVDWRPRRSINSCLTSRDLSYLRGALPRSSVRTPTCVSQWRTQKWRLYAPFSLPPAARSRYQKPDLNLCTLPQTPRSPELHCLPCGVFLRREGSVVPTGFSWKGK
jgi:hypothetical protein